MKKALLVTTVSGFIPQFEMNNVRLLQEAGYEIHYAANYDMPVYGDNSRLEGTGIICHQVDFVKSPFSIKNIKVYRQLNNIAKEINKDGELEIVHCHTPMGGAMARLVAKKYRKNGTRVIYTAHGFHFFKGAGIVNWLVFYTAEKHLSRYTDALITINKEDYNRAAKFHMKKLFYTPGVGVSLSHIQNLVCDRDEVRKKLGLGTKDYCLVSVGELSKRKNHKVVIEALEHIPNKSVKYVICGSGAYDEYLRNLAAEKNVSDRVVFAGYRTDAVEILKAMDLFVFPSLQEGLPVALMEALAAGLPAVASRIRGNEDLVDEPYGILVEKDDVSGYVKAIEKSMKYSPAMLERIRVHNTEVLDGFTLDKVEKVMKKVYAFAEKR